MLPEHRVLDDPCPVTDQMPGEMYRAGAHGLNELIATVSNSENFACCVLLPRGPSCFDWTSDCGNPRAGQSDIMLFERSRKAQLPSLTDARASSRAAS
jgi:hypothetical protein